MKATGGKEQSEGGTLTSMICFKYGEFGNHVFECKSITVNCFKCGKTDQRAAKCKGNMLTFYNCVEQRHIST